MKQVSDTTEVKLDAVTNNLIREGIPAIINPDDKCGIECALEIKERKQFGKSIFKQQNTQFQLADMVARTDAAKWLVYNAAMTKQAGEKYGVAAAKAKLFAAETAMAVTTKAVQLFGGYGYTRDYPVERMMRDAKITEIYEGTSEVQRMVIAGSL